MSRLSMVCSLTWQYSIFYGCNNATHTPPVNMPTALHFFSTYSLSPLVFFLPLLHPSCTCSFSFSFYSLFSYSVSSSIIFLLSLLASSLFNLPPCPFFSNPLSPSISVRLCCGPQALHFVVHWPLPSTWHHSGISVISISVTCLSIF